jgi:hypothetical protein
MHDQIKVRYLLSTNNTFEDCPDAWKKFIQALNIPWQVKRSTRHEIIHEKLAMWNACVVSDEHDEWMCVEFGSESDLVSWLITYS